MITDDYNILVYDQLLLRACDKPQIVNRVRSLTDKTPSDRGMWDVGFGVWAKNLVLKNLFKELLN